MEYRQLGRSGLRISALTLCAADLALLGQHLQGS